MTHMRRPAAVPVAPVIALLVALAVAACSGSGPAPVTSPTAAPPPTVVLSAMPPGSAAPVTGPYAPTIDPGAFTTTVDNPFFPLRPGMTWEYRANTAEGPETTVVTVT